MTGSGHVAHWAFMVGMVCVAQWDAVFGRFWRGDGHTRWQNATWRFPGVFDAETATRLGVTAIIQH